MRFPLIRPESLTQTLYEMITQSHRLDCVPPKDPSNSYFLMPMTVVPPGNGVTMDAIELRRGHTRLPTAQGDGGVCITRGIWMCWCRDRDMGRTLNTDEGRDGGM